MKRDDPANSPEGLKNEIANAQRLGLLLDKSVRKFARQPNAHHLTTNDESLYRTLDNRSASTVITFAAITVAKTLATQLREKHTALMKRGADASVNGLTAAMVKAKRTSQREKIAGLR